MTTLAAEFLSAMTAQVPVVPLAGWYELPKGWVFWGPFQGQADAALAKYRSRHDRWPRVIYTTPDGACYVCHDQQGDVVPDELLGVE